MMVNDGIALVSYVLLTITVNKLRSNENDALRLAEQAGLDLVLVSPNAKPPVARIHGLW